MDKHRIKKFHFGMNGFFAPSSNDVSAGFDPTGPPIRCKAIKNIYATPQKRAPVDAHIDSNIYESIRSVRADRKYASTETLNAPSFTARASRAFSACIDELKSTRLKKGASMSSVAAVAVDGPAYAAVAKKAASGNATLDVKTRKRSGSVSENDRRRLECLVESSRIEAARKTDAAAPREYVTIDLKDCGAASQRVDHRLRIETSRDEPGAARPVDCATQVHIDSIDPDVVLTASSADDGGASVVNVTFKSSFTFASAIVTDVATSTFNFEYVPDEAVASGGRDSDWSYVQKWRCRPSGTAWNDTSPYHNTSNRVNTPANVVHCAQQIVVDPKQSDAGSGDRQQQQQHAKNPVGVSSVPNSHPAQCSDKQLVGAKAHHHPNGQEPKSQRRIVECNSPSDDNRSSGHASMSDTGHNSPAGAASRVTSQRRTGGGAARHRTPWGGAGGLDDIRRAIQQLSLRSGSSTHSSAGSDASEHRRRCPLPPPAALHRLVRHSSLETVNTNVTSADEFVWVDSHDRLVELLHLPWSQKCVERVLNSGRCREHLSRVGAEVVPRLSYLLQRALVRIGREIQRLAGVVGICSKQEVASAFRIVLGPPLAESCVKACLRAATMFAVSGDCVLRQSKSSRAGLQFPVGRFHRWMADVRLGKFVHEYAAVYLCAGMENLLEEILVHCLPSDPDVNLTATILEHGIANNGDLWGLLQPYAHLNAGRIATGVLAMPCWAASATLGSKFGTESSEPSLLTTCVGSLNELRELVKRIRPRVPLSDASLQTLFYFMRCSQLEHADQGTSDTVQELCYERAYVVLPPLIEWLRVACAFGEHRHASTLDRDDIMQAARLLLPGVDCPPRPLVCSDDARTSVDLAFRLLLCGNVHQALPLLPTDTRLDTVDSRGMTPLMIAAVSDDVQIIDTLLDAGADVDAETPGPAEMQHWTALTYAVAAGNYRSARSLLEHGASVEGGARLSEDKCTLTPLQIAGGGGNLEIISLLLSHGADAFLSTLQKDVMCYSGSVQRGCYSAISVAAVHGRRAALHKLVAQPPAPPRTDVLSLEEMLAEGQTKDRVAPIEPSKTQLRSLQEAMCHGAEADHLDVALDIRALGVSWTLHCWMHALTVALHRRLDSVIDQLLQDFLQVCPDDYGQQFVQECLPLLFDIFRYSKKEGTILLLADIFCTCYGWEAIGPIGRPDPFPTSGSRIDPKFVNNPELSDVTFRVEGRVFYGHKIVLVTASPRLRAMLSSKLCEGSPPVVQINDIRYDIFQIVMQFLYRGGCQAIEPASEDILELMAAANFFQLDGLLQYCEARCAAILDLDNVVSLYIHAKVYEARRLLEYCQGFLLQNMVALLTYDDSVKRLMFSKKLPNHDVLAGLLTTLQERIKARASTKSTIRTR